MLGKVINMSPMKIYAYKIIPLYGKVYLMPNYSTGTKHLTFINAQVQKLEELEEDTAYTSYVQYVQQHASYQRKGTDRT